MSILKVSPISGPSVASSFKIVDADVEMPTANGPGYFTITYLDTGQATNASPSIPSTPTLGSSISAQIGGMQVTGVVVSKDVSKRAGNHQYIIRAIDNSHRLDKIFVSLLNVTHEAGATQLPYVIYVGTEIDPCKGLSRKTDLCDPCNDQPQLEVQCFEEKELRVLDTDYTMNDLISAAASRGISISQSGDPLFSQHRRSYTGTLREVLQNWCADFGYTFISDGVNVEFIDLREGIEIFPTQQSNIIEEGVTESLENSYAEHTTIRFAKDGEIRRYECGRDWGKILSCNPVFVDSLWGNDTPLLINNEDSRFYNNSQNLIIAAILGKYSEELRDAFVFYNIYNEGTVGEGDMPLLGLKRIDTIKRGNSDIKKRSFYEQAIQSLYPSESGGVTLTRKHEESRGVYFLTAIYDESKRSMFREFESNIVDMLGKYFYRFVNENYADDYYVLVPENDSISYIPRGVSSENQDTLFHRAFPFLRNMPSKSAIFDNFATSQVANSSGLFVVERSPLWEIEPVDSEAINFDKNLNFMEEISVPEKNHSDQQTLTSDLDTALDANLGYFESVRKNNQGDINKLKVFKVLPFNYYDGDMVSVTIPNDTINSPVETSGSVELPWGGKEEAGITNTSTRQIKVSVAGGNDFIIIPPVGAIEIPNESLSYRSVVIKSGSSEAEVTQPKILKVKVIKPEGDKHIRIIHKHIDVTNEDLDLLSSQCTINQSTVNQYLNVYDNNFSINRASDSNIPDKKHRIVVSGEPILASFGSELIRGLQSVSVRLSADGYITTLVYSSIAKSRISEDIIKEKITRELTPKQPRKVWNAASAIQPPPSQALSQIS